MIFDAVQIIHQSFPERSIAHKVTLETELFGRSFATPFSSTPARAEVRKRKINQDLAEVAKACDLMMATGSVSQLH